MATIKAIEASSVHQIQSGQVIVDLCSVAKELVENGLDAGATSIDVRFRNQGLDLIEVQDNGSGIAPSNYQSLALKHYTSKLSSYADLSTLETFGFRGEALSSLCALSRFTVITCLQLDVPKGTKLEFETSGKLKHTSVVAAQKGTTVSVENLFQNLPVRRRELERNIKREWSKVISLLNQYACVQTGVKFTVSQQPNKGRRITLFSTKGNKTSRENIVNVFGAKTMAALLALDLELGLEPSSGPSQRWGTQDNGGTIKILIQGYVSRPVHGEGRQTPDRQMFYVNNRPCGLPQFAKVFNEVYRSFNSSQSPFIFANIQLDTHLYDVNVSPDKRTILLHDQSRMLENLRSSLTELFEGQDYTVPLTQIATFKQTPFKKPTVPRQETTGDSVGSPIPAKDPLPVREGDGGSGTSEKNIELSPADRMRNLAAAKALAKDAQASGLMTHWVERKLETREKTTPAMQKVVVTSEESKEDSPIARDTTTWELTDESAGIENPDASENQIRSVDSDAEFTVDAEKAEDGLLARLSKIKRSFLPESLQNEMSDDESHDQPPIPAIVRPVKPPDNTPLNVSATRPPKRQSQEVATITVGGHTVTSVIGTPSKRLRMEDQDQSGTRQSQKAQEADAKNSSLPSFGGRLTQMFASATSKQKLENENDVLCTKEMSVDEVSQEYQDSESEARSVLPRDDAGSDGEDAKSSPLFVDQDEDDHLQSSISSGQRTDEGLGDGNEGNYVDEEDKDREVQEINTAAEELSQEPGEDHQKRTQTLLKGGGKGKYSTQALLQRLQIDEETLKCRLVSMELERHPASRGRKDNMADDLESSLEAENAEEKLSLTIHKGDFGKMKIAGQFNLGFILAVRPGTLSPSSARPTPQATGHHQDDNDELFIIDQHASDEKFNFERLQATTIVQSQRLVRPKHLELTAVEEEIVIENLAALEKNGFVVEVDQSGDEPVGSRCQLLSLPLSRETTFSLADLEELISLLGESPTGENSSGEDGGYVPRPSKVRKMFAMRACRSSVMIGKALSQRQMENVVRHMGDMEKPWNCPHGRPTMRHLCGLGAVWDERAWKEGDGVDDFDSGTDGGKSTTDWAGYVRQTRRL